MVGTPLILLPNKKYCDRKSDLDQKEKRTTTFIK